jgi:hypothetical protein
MKKLLAIILLAFASVTFAANEFKFHFIEEQESYTIAYVDSDWKFVAKESTYQLYLNKGGFAKSDEMFKMHSMIVFTDEVKYDQIPVPVKKIYSFGLIECDTAKLYLITDFFTDANNKIVWVQRHQMGDFITNLDAPNTPREQVFISVCGKEAI